MRIALVPILFLFLRPALLELLVLELLVLA